MALSLDGTLGVPVTTVTGTLPVANGGTGGSTSTGTGAVVLAISPSLTTPALGTPASGALTNCTGGLRTAGTTGTLNPLSLNSLTTTAHGLGAMPHQLVFYIECITAEAGWVAGNRIYASGASQINGNYGFNVSADATNTFISTGSSTVYPIPKAGGAGVGLTAAYWKIVVTPIKWT